MFVVTYCNIYLFIVTFNICAHILKILIKMLYSFIFFHTTIQVNDPEAPLSDMSNKINKKPCKNTTQAGTNHKILLNY